MSTTIDEARVEAFVGQVATDIGAALGAALVAIGDELGLYRAMADGLPCSAAEIAVRTGTHERYVREWLNAQAAAGYVAYDPNSDRYALPAEHAFVLADETSPLAMAGMFQAATASIDGRKRVSERFRTGEGVAGTNIMVGSSAVWSARSGPTTAPTSCPRGCPQSMAWWRSSRSAAEWPTSAVVMGRR